MFWYIILVIAIVILIVSIVKIVQDIDSFWWIATILCSAVIVFISLATIIAPLKYKKEMATFVETKRYIEEVAPRLSQTDNYAITNSRIEMNKWLYEIQFRYKNYSFFNFVPAEVMQLREIK